MPNDMVGQVGCALQGGLAGITRETLLEAGLSCSVWLTYSHLLYQTM